MFQKRRATNAIFGMTLLSLLIPILLFGWFSADSTYRSLQKEAVTQNRVAAETVANAVEQYISGPYKISKQALAFIESNLSVHSEMTVNYLQCILDSNPIFTYIEILDSRGKVLQNCPHKTKWIGETRANEDYYKAVNESGKVHFSNPAFFSESNDLSVMLAIPGKDYIIVSHLNIRVLSNYAISMKGILDIGEELAMTDNQGVFISNRNITDVYQRKFDVHFEEIKQMVQQKKEFAVLKYSNTSMLVSAAQIPMSDWYVISYSSLDKLFNSVYVRLFKILLMVVLVFFPLMLILAAKNGRRLSHSFVTFIEQIKKIAQGRFDHRISPQYFVEFQQMAESFHKMGDALHERDQKLSEMAYYDGLTRLPNRLLFSDQVNRAIEESTQNKRKLALLYIDIDNFKTVNDTSGHEIGDKVLVEVGSRLKACVKTSDAMARMGGDEYTLLLQNIENTNIAASVAQRVVQTMSQPFSIDNSMFYLGVSIGIAWFPDDGDSYKELLKNADTAMYKAKREGKNSFCFYSNALQKEMQDKVNLGKGLRQALSNNELTIAYQPLFDLRNGELAGAEALMHWQSAEFDSISPLTFIPIAEEIGLIHTIGEWILREACAKVKQFLDRGLSFGFISINISVEQLKRKDFVELVLGILSDVGLLPQHLMLEITESMMIDSLNLLEIIDKLKRLQERGIRIALDDFGTGYSSLSYIRTIPCDVLKVDRSFLTLIEEDSRGGNLINSIINLAHSLKLQTVFEGVETALQYDFLSSSGCDYVQGYYLCRPIPDVEFENMLISFK